MSNQTDQWLEWYKGFRAELVRKYGSAGASTSTGSSMPRFQWVDALAVCTYIAMEMARTIAAVNRRVTERAAYGRSAFWTTTYNREPTTARRVPVDAATFLSGFPLVLGTVASNYKDIISEAMSGKSLSKIWYSKFTAKQIAECDHTKRLCLVNGGYEVCELTGEVGMDDYPWFSSALSNYNKITSTPSLVLASTDNLPGVGYLKLPACEMVMSAVYQCVLDMSTQAIVPSLSWSDVGGQVKQLAEDAVDAGAEAIGKGVGWIAEQGGRAVGIAAAGALDETGIYGLVVLGIGAYLVVG